jgi:hypothetical protein
MNILIIRTIAILLFSFMIWQCSIEVDPTPLVCTNQISEQDAQAITDSYQKLSVVADSILRTKKVYNGWIMMLKLQNIK